MIIIMYGCICDLQVMMVNKTCVPVRMRMTIIHGGSSSKAVVDSGEQCRLVVVGE